MSAMLDIVDWSVLGVDARRAVLQRAPQTHDESLVAGVVRIIAQVRADGDTALRALTRRFDACELVGFAVTPEEFAAARVQLDPAVARAIEEASSRIELFHRATAPQSRRVQTAPGVICERVLRPIARVGLYVPAGSAPLPSTALMLGVPAQIAQCPQVTLCTPPNATGHCDPGVLYAAALCGITRVLKLGGAQAIAALAFGTATVPKVDRIVGPGNIYVAAAKKLRKQKNCLKFASSFM